MRPEDVLNWVQRQPFVPFRVHLSDGNAHDVRHPQLMQVFRSFLHFSVPSPGTFKQPYEDCFDVALDRVDRIEPLAAPAQPVSS